MALKSVIDIDLDTSKFERFQSLFDRYTQALQKQPEVWKKLGGMHQEHAGNFEDMAATIGKITALQKQMGEADRAQEKHLTLSSKLWTSISRASKETYGSVEMATRSLAKWTGILGGIGLGLLGVGGIFGFDRLAGSISGQRRSAAGVGMSIGEQKAFAQHFGRFVDPDAFTGWVAGMQQDVTQQWRAQALLNRPLTGTSRDMLDVLDAARNYARSAQFKGAAGLSMLGPSFQAMGLDLPADTIRRLRDSGDAEYNRERGTYAADAAKLNIPDRGAEAYQNFQQQMARAAGLMQAQLAPALLGLVGPLTNLSGAFGKALGAFLKTEAVKDSIGALATGLNNLATFLNSNAFSKWWKIAGDVIDDPRTGSKEALDNWTWGQKQWADFKGDLSKLRNKLAPTHDWAAANLPAYMARVDQHYGLGAGSVELIKRLENSGARAISPAGARGMFQWEPDVKGGKYSFDPFDPVASANKTGERLAQLLQHFGGNIPEVLAAYNAGQKRVDDAVNAAARAGRSDWLAYTGRETQAYVGRGMQILLTNQTGGDVNTSVAAMGPAVAP